MGRAWEAGTRRGCTERASPAVQSERSAAQRRAGGRPAGGGGDVRDAAAAAAAPARVGRGAGERGGARGPRGWRQLCTGASPHPGRALPGSQVARGAVPTGGCGRGGGTRGFPRRRCCRSHCSIALPSREPPRLPFCLVSGSALSLPGIAAGRGGGLCARTKLGGWDPALPCPALGQKLLGGSGSLGARLHEGS